MNANQITVTYTTANGTTAKISQSGCGDIKIGQKADATAAVVVIAMTGDESEATVTAIEQA